MNFGGSMIPNRGEHKMCPDQVFNFKIVSFANRQESTQHKNMLASKVEISDLIVEA